MGYSVPAAVGAKIAFPRAHGGQPGRRRRIPDDGTGDRHGVPPRRRADRAGVQQPDVRHDPHAPGTHLSVARVRHRADQSRLREIHRGVRRPRRGGERDRRIRPGVSSRRGKRPSGGDRAAGEPGADHHAPDHRAVARRQGAAEARGETEARGGTEASEAGARARPAPASREAERRAGMVYRLSTQFRTDATGRRCRRRAVFGQSRSLRSRQRRRHYRARDYAAAAHKCDAILALPAATISTHCICVACCILDCGATGARRWTICGAQSRTRPDDRATAVPYRQRAARAEASSRRRGRFSPCVGVAAGRSRYAEQSWQRAVRRFAL